MRRDSLIMMHMMSRIVLKNWTDPQNIVIFTYDKWYLFIHLVMYINRCLIAQPLLFTRALTVLYD